VSSLVLAEGPPAVVWGLVTESSDLWDVMRSTGSFVVHILDGSQRRLADRFAGVFPSPGGLFSQLDVVDSEWGLVLSGFPNRAYCRFEDEAATGHHHLVRGTIERIDLDEFEEPLVYFRGRYRKLSGR
jgi:3-hydroxy-9,10-secoandrosta-1,3,5(10)-triene-9,17-dione monooxygenase reductase component